MKSRHLAFTNITAARLGTVLAAGAAFFAMNAAPASAAAAEPAAAAPAAAASSSAVAWDCWTPLRRPYDYLLPCNSQGQYVYFHYLGSFPCGPGGIRSYYRFDRTFYWGAGDPTPYGTVSSSCA